MIIKKAGQSIIQSKKSIFLAGPTPRNKIEVPSWRADALQLLEGYGFNGVVYVPEGKIEQGEYIDQAEWEWEALNSSDVTTFWVPRDLSKDSQGEMKMPAFTTNVEFGQQVPQGKVIYGRPDGAKKCRYLDAFYKKFTGKEPCRTLEETLEKSIIEAQK